MSSTELIPRDKHDFERMRTLIEAGPAAAEPILSELLTWLQDMNWPITKPMADFLVTVGPPLIPHLHKVLISNDDIWIYWVLQNVVAKLPPDQIRLLTNPLYGLATSSENDIVAIRIAASAAIWDSKTLTWMIDTHISAYESYVAELKGMKQNMVAEK